MIREAKPRDIPAIIGLGIEAMNIEPYPNTIINIEKCHDMATSCVSSAMNFAWVCEEEGKVVGAVCAMTTSMIFHERSQLTVLQFYCKGKPHGLLGDGIQMIRKMVEWADGRRAIKAIVFTLEHYADPRIGRLLERLGFGLELPVYMRFPNVEGRQRDSQRRQARSEGRQESVQGRLEASAR